ncbi:MAG: DUF5016 domain-containing protein [Bacteroidota bacterium]|nr:DUF5016 domain-containing protein [Bacteroidota bacterium]
MKNSIKFIVLICLSFVIWGCTNEDVVVRYPKSTPHIDTAFVKETQITYGDSIHLRIAVSDKVAPLSTLLLRVICNNEVVTSETIRTKGNSSEVSRTYGVPFVANRPDNAAVKIYLTETNVSGFTKDSIVSTTIAKRPSITNLYIVPDLGQGASAKLTLIDATNLIYKVTGLPYSNSFNYKIATKLNKFKRIDWTGLVFGKLADGSVGLVDSTGLSLPANDPTLVSISEFTFDALKFTSTVGGKLLEPVTTLDVNNDLILNPSSLNEPTGFRGNNVYFGENVEVTFTGFTGTLVNSISPDYFQVTGTNKAKFLGKTGLYKAYYLTSADYLYIEPQPSAIYPDVLWINGAGFGRPQASPTLTTTPWNWNSPLEYAPCRPISAGVYQVTIYAKNNLGTDGFGSLNFKFFDQRGWTGSEETSSNYTVSLPLVSRTDVGNVGNVGGSPTPFEGIYQITLNQNDKTIKAVKLN